RKRVEARPPTRTWRSECLEPRGLSRLVHYYLGRSQRAGWPMAGSGLTRRRFLQALALAGGAGAVVGAMEVLDLAPRARQEPFTPPSPSDFSAQGRENTASVVVLGAGVAGLAAAYGLEEAGDSAE